MLKESNGQRKNEVSWWLDLV